MKRMLANILVISSTAMLIGMIWHLASVNSSLRVDIIRLEALVERLSHIDIGDVTIEVTPVPTPTILPTTVPAPVY